MSEMQGTFQVIEDGVLWHVEDHRGAIVKSFHKQYFSKQDAWIYAKGLRVDAIEKEQVIPNWPTPEKLKPCPWCANNCEAARAFEVWFVRCMNFDCLVQPCSKYHRSTREAAIAAWNTRLAPEPQEKA